MLLGTCAALEALGVIDALETLFCRSLSARPLLQEMQIMRNDNVGENTVDDNSNALEQGRPNHSCPCRCGEKLACSEAEKSKNETAPPFVLNNPELNRYPVLKALQQGTLLTFARHR